MASKIDFSKLVDDIYKAKQTIKARDAKINKDKKEVAELKFKVKELEAKMLGGLKTQKLKGVRGQTSSCSISKREAFKVVNWGKFWRWAVKNDASECVEKRVSKTAILDRITKENGKRKATPSGLEHSEWEELSVTKNPATK